MNIAMPNRIGIVCGVLLLGAATASGQDWPQWRGPNRDNKVAGFVAPPTWPKELTRKWSVAVGAGDASPVLVGDRVYVFGRQGGDEVTTCLDAGSSKTVWQDVYPSQPATGAAGGIHAGPRSTPVVAEGKVCTLGARGVVSCLDAMTGKVQWRKETGQYPKFFVAASPLILDGKCIACVGAVTAFDLADGSVKWKLSGESPSYGSPVLMTADGRKQLVVPTSSDLVGLDAADGTLLWKVAYAGKYNSCTPVIDGATLFYSNPPSGTVAYKIEHEGNKFRARELWKKSIVAHQYNTPTLAEGMLFGLTGGKGYSSFFCLDEKTGETLWTDSTRRGECGSILNAGSVLLGLTSDADLVVFAPSPKGYSELARYKVSDSPTWAVPVVSGKRLFVKGRDSLTLWEID